MKGKKIISNGGRPDTYNSWIYKSYTFQLLINYVESSSLSDYNYIANIVVAKNKSFPYYTVRPLLFLSQEINYI